MCCIDFRMGTNKFNDLQSYPDGFAASGKFTYKEEELLTYWGEMMSGLEQKSLFPANKEEEHFLLVLEKPHLARSSLEKVWLKYRSLQAIL